MKCPISNAGSKRHSAVLRPRDNVLDDSRNSIGVFDIRDKVGWAIGRNMMKAIDFPRYHIDLGQNIGIEEVTQCQEILLLHRKRSNLRR